MRRAQLATRGRAPALTRASEAARCRCHRVPGPSGQVLQAKVRIGPVDDPLEREADRAADAVLAGASAPHLGSLQAGLQRKCAACEREEQRTLRRQADMEEEDEELRMKTAPGGPISAGADAATAVAARGGRPLTPTLRGYFEPRFGHDLSAVRLHTDAAAASSAAAINARAFTLGRHIAFAAGQYAPDSRSGLQLIAHELAHVVQQRDEAHVSTIRRKLVLDQPSSLIPNPGGKGAKQSNADTARDYLSTLCPDGKPSVASAGEVSLTADFCKDQPLPAGQVGPPTPAPASLSATRVGCGCLCDMIASANLWTIKIDDTSWPHTSFDDPSKATTPGSGGTGGIVTAPSPNSGKLWGAATASGKQGTIDPWLVLGHELCGHGWLGDRGGHGPDEAAPRGEGGHQETVARENLIRQEHGIEARGTFKEPYCGESFWRDKRSPGKINWSRYLDVCKRWRRDYNKKHGTKYTISDPIP